MNIQELKKIMEHVPDHKMRHNTPMNKPMAKANALTKAKGGTPKTNLPYHAVIGGKGAQFTKGEMRKTRKHEREDRLIAQARD